jgi:membrane fusion protein (multidrug efflux system)
VAANLERPSAPPVEDVPARRPEREPFPEEAGAVSRRDRARGYFRQHPRAKWIALVVVVVLAAVGYAVWRYYSVRETTDDAQVDGHIDPISSRVAGTVKSVAVDDNQYVEAGTVLVQLDPTDFQVAVDRARAELADAQASLVAARQGVPVSSASARSNLETANAAVAGAHQQIDAARANLAQAQANYTKAASDLNRMKQLVARDEISQQQYDAAVANADAARAAVEAAQAQLAMMQSRETEARAGLSSAQTAPHQIEATVARAGSAEAAVARAKTALQQAELNLQYATIRAPQAGIVSKRTVEPGQVVQTGQPLLAIVYISDLWATANFKETQLKKMKVGDPAQVEVDAYGSKLRGTVDSIGGATGARFSLLPPENATGNYVKVVQRVPVKVVFERGQEHDVQRLRPGMSVNVTVKVSR